MRRPRDRSPHTARVPAASPWLPVLALAVSSLAGSADAQDWGRPVWSDEFAASADAAPDPAKWTFDTGDLRVNNEVEFYCATGSSTPPCDASHPNAAQDGRGNLVIQAIRTSSGTWTSARLKTQGLRDFQYGRIEARLRLPVGAGLWPAFWMLGTSIATAGWPACGEIDFMENVPATASANPLGPTTIRATIHGPGYSGANGLGQNHTLAGGGQVHTAFHTYGAIWSPFMIQFYVDDPDDVFFIRTADDVPAGTRWVFEDGFFAILNLAVGGDWPGPPDATTPSPARMLVDHVRVYQPAPVPGPAMSAPAIAVKAGATGSSAVALASPSGGGRVYLVCGGAPAKSTCSLSPYVVDFSSSSSATATVTVATAAASTAALWDLGPRAAGPAGTIVALGLVLGCVGIRGVGARLRLGLALAGLLVAAAAVPACGGGGGRGASGTPPGSYTLTVTAYTVSGHTSTVAIPLTVN